MGQPEGMEFLQRRANKMRMEEFDQSVADVGSFDQGVADIGSQLGYIEEFEAFLNCSAYQRANETRVQLAIQGVIDIGDMLKKQKQDMNLNVKLLKQKVSSAKGEVKKAKSVYKDMRKAIRSQYKACKKRFRGLKGRKRKLQDESECRIFLPYLMTPEEAKEKPKCARRSKCLLREAKRKHNRELKDEYKKVRATARDFKKELRKAKFQKAILPKIMAVLKWPLTMAMKKADLGGSGSGVFQTCDEGQTDDCASVDKIDTEKLFKTYAELAIHRFMFPFLFKTLIQLKQAIIAFLTPIVQTIKASIIGVVGSIPFIGGALATAVGVLFDILFTGVKIALHISLRKLHYAVQPVIVSKMVKAIMATGLFTTDKLSKGVDKKTLTEAAEKSQKGAIQDEENNVQKEATKEEANAKAEADSAESSAKSSGQQASDEEAEENKEEDQEDDEEDSADDADEDDD